MICFTRISNSSDLQMIIDKNIKLISSDVNIESKNIMRVDLLESVGYGPTLIITCEDLVVGVCVAASHNINFALEKDCRNKYIFVNLPIRLECLLLFFAMSNIPIYQNNALVHYVSVGDGWFTENEYIKN